MSPVPAVHHKLSTSLFFVPDVLVFFRIGAFGTTTQQSVYQAMEINQDKGPESRKEKEKRAIHLGKKKH